MNRGNNNLIYIEIVTGMSNAYMSRSDTNPQSYINGTSWLAMQLKIAPRPFTYAVSRLVSSWERVLLQARNGDLDWAGQLVDIEIPAGSSLRCSYNLARLIKGDLT